MAFTETNDISKPAGGRDKSLGDDDIREFKRLEIERQAVEHDRRDDEAGAEKTVTPTGTIGYHKKTTLLVRTSDPAAVANAAIIYTKDVLAKAEVHVIDEDSNVMQLFTAGKLNTALLKADLAATVALITKFAHPVGSIYINAAVATNPATLLGFGTWVAFGAGRVMVGLDGGDPDFDTVEETGGAKTHTLTTAEIPAHTHIGYKSYNTTGDEGGSEGWRDGIQKKDSVTTPTGGGGAHNNLQPSIVVYMWKRTA